MSRFLPTLFTASRMRSNDDCLYDRIFDLQPLTAVLPHAIDRRANWTHRGAQRFAVRALTRRLGVLHETTIVVEMADCMLSAAARFKEASEIMMAVAVVWITLQSLLVRSNRLVAPIQVL
jgi:hypothetical protein